MKFDRIHIALIVSGLVTAVVSCVPWLAPAHHVFELVAVGLVGLGIPVGVKEKSE